VNVTKIYCKHFYKHPNVSSVQQYMIIKIKVFKKKEKGRLMPGSLLYLLPFLSPDKLFLLSFPCHFRIRDGNFVHVSYIDFPKFFANLWLPQHQILQIIQIWAWLDLFIVFKSVSPSHLLLYWSLSFPSFYLFVVWFVFVQLAPLDTGIGAWFDNSLLFNVVLIGMSFCLRWSLTAVSLSKYYTDNLFMSKSGVTMSPKLLC
jgi:hypothetical protein